MKTKTLALTFVLALSISSMILVQTVKAQSMEIDLEFVSSPPAYVNQPFQIAATVSGGTPPYTYQWYTKWFPPWEPGMDPEQYRASSGNEIAVPDATSATFWFTPTVEGIYWISVGISDSAGQSVSRFPSIQPFQLIVQNPQPLNLTIKSDGSVEPSTNLLERNGTTYTFKGDIFGTIWVQINNIIIDGAGHAINGVSSSTDYPALNDGLNLRDVTNVTVRDIEISGFNDFDISIENCHSCIIQKVKANTFYLDNSHLNTINESKVAGNDFNVQAAIIMSLSNNNKIYKNSINGIILKDSDNNIFFENNIVFQHTVIFGGSENNSWDNYSSGNYWSDYLTRYPIAIEIDDSGIGNTPYVIDTNNTDRYPLTHQVDINAVAPTPSVPEFQLWTIPLLLIIMVAAGLLVYHKKHKHNSV